MAVIYTPFAFREGGYKSFHLPLAAASVKLSGMDADTTAQINIIQVVEKVYTTEEFVKEIERSKNDN